MEFACSCFVQGFVSRKVRFLWHREMGKMIAFCDHNALNSNLEVTKFLWKNLKNHTFPCHLSYILNVCSLSFAKKKIIRENSR